MNTMPTYITQNYGVKNIIGYKRFWKRYAILYAFLKLKNQGRKGAIYTNVINYINEQYTYDYKEQWELGLLVEVYDIININSKNIEKVIFNERNN